MTYRVVDYLGRTVDFVTAHDCDEAWQQAHDEHGSVDGLFVEPVHDDDGSGE